MSIPIANIRVRVVSPAEIKTSRKGEYFSMIVDVGTITRPEHWYANVYANTDYPDSSVEDVVEAAPGSTLLISGRVRKWQLRHGGFGVAIDVAEGVIQN